MRKIAYFVTRRGRAAELARIKARAKIRAKSAIHAQFMAARRLLDSECAAEHAKETAQLYCRRHASVFAIKAILLNSVRLSCGCVREGFRTVDPLSRTISKSRVKSLPIFVDDEAETES
jgi:hypothetical protein